MEPKKVIKLKKKYAFILVIVLLGLFVVVMGASYAFFTSTVSGKEYVVYSGSLAVTYEKKTNVVNLQAAKPMTNTEGLATTAYSFDVKNTGTIVEKYQVRLEEDTNNSTLPLEYVKISVYKNDTEYLKPTKLSDLNGNLVIVDNGLLQGMTNDTPTSDNYKVRLWVDISTPNDMIGKQFKGRIVIDAMQNVEDGYDVDTKPIITLAKDSNGNIDILLEKNATYTELGVESVKDDKDILTPSNVTITGTVDTTAVGINNITYSVTDSNNNTTTVTRKVIVNDGTLPIYTSVSAVINSFTAAEKANKETIMCDHIYGDGDLYLNCDVYDTIENALASRLRGTVILIDDITSNNQITINSSMDMILDLNGKTLSSSSHAILNAGKLIINNSSNNTGSIISPSTSTYAAIVQDGGYLVVNDGVYLEGMAGIARHTTGSTTIINGATIHSKSLGAIYVGDNRLNGNITINGGTFTSEDGAAIRANSASTINVLGGTFISENSYSILNSSTATINIIQTDKPIYISTTSNDKAVIYNSGSGFLNINAKQANACTSNSSATTSGLCLYSNGTGDYAFGIDNPNAGGIINVNGGTYVTSKFTFVGRSANTSNASMTLENVYATSDERVIYNNGAGTININSGVYSSNSSYTVVNSSPGTINITQTDKPIYMTTLAADDLPVIYNFGNFNIEANVANQCTSNASDTTSGLCVYAEGDGSTNNSGNRSIKNASGSIFNIDGGTYCGYFTAIGNLGTLNIKNANIISPRLAVANSSSSGIVNICSSTLTSGNNVDLYSTVNGKIYYSTDVVFTDGTNNPSTYVDTGGIITEVATCPISE